MSWWLLLNACCSEKGTCKKNEKGTCKEHVSVLPLPNFHRLGKRNISEGLRKDLCFVLLESLVQVLDWDKRDSAVCCKQPGAKTTTFPFLPIQMSIIKAFV